MDFKKKIIIYGSVLAGLVVLFVVGTVVSLSGRGPAGEKLFPGLAAGSVAAVSVTDQAGKLELAKAGDAWKIKADGREFEAARDAVESLFTNFSELRKKSTVSSDQSTWPQFDLDEGKAVHIVLTDAAGRALAECFFGKGGSTSFSQYVRLAGSDEVIQIDQRVEKTSLLKDWVERRLFKEFAVDEVARVAVASDLSFNDQAASIKRKIAYTLTAGEKDKDGVIAWKLVENERLPMASSKVSSLVSALANFRAEDVVMEPEKLKLDPTKPQGSVTVTLKSGTAYAFRLLGQAADPNSYYVTNQDAKFIYLATNWAVKNLFSGAEGLIDANALLSGMKKDQP